MKTRPNTDINDIQFSLCHGGYIIMMYKSGYPDIQRRMFGSHRGCLLQLYFLPVVMLLNPFIPLRLPNSANRFLSSALFCSPFQF